MQYFENLEINMNTDEHLIERDDDEPFWKHSSGRKKRQAFAVRDYGPKKTAYMVVPLCIAGDIMAVNFYMSADGFTLELSPTGNRKLSPNSTGNCLTVMMPAKIRDRIATKDGAGTVDVTWDQLEDGRFFFPFRQFSEPDPVDELIRL